MSYVSRVLRLTVLAPTLLTDPRRTEPKGLTCCVNEGVPHEMGTQRRKFVASDESSAYSF